MGVTGGIGEAIAVYALREGEAAEVIPLALVWEAGYEEPAETEEAKTEVETEEDPFLETETEEIPAGDDEPVGVFLGCRETAVADGVYAVQFLFDGGTPVVCMEGGGVAYLQCGAMPPLEVSRGGGVWSYCTFSVLSAQRTYRFAVETEEGTVTVTYENGVFAGFG